MDTGFDTDGKVTTDFGTNVAIAYSVVIQPADGKIVVAGGYDDFALARYYATATGISEIDFINKLTIHPNPNSGEFTLEMELTKSEDFQIKVINIAGQVIYTEKLKGIYGKYQKTIDISNFANGIYTVQLITEKGTVNKQITVH